MEILVVSDKFKGTLSSVEAGRAIAAGLAPLAAGCGCEVVVESMADGGEGTGSALGGEPVAGYAGIWRLPGGDMLVESAGCVGRASADLMSRPLRQRPSSAFGEALDAALRMSAPEATVYAAIGGTVTADGGAGMLQALGYTFYDRAGRRITDDITPAIVVERLGCVREPSADVLRGLRRRLCGLSDVRAALCDSGRLSALDFLQQKGADESEMPLLCRSFSLLRAMLAGNRESDFDGAGGGIGFALAAVAGVPVLSGAEHVLGRILARRPRPLLLATGEGSVDGQTAGGKVVGAVNAFGLREGIGVLTVGGRVAGDAAGVYPCVLAAGAGDVPASAAEAAARIEAAVRKNIGRIRRLIPDVRD